MLEDGILIASFQLVIGHCLQASLQLIWEDAKL